MYYGLRKKYNPPSLKLGLLYIDLKFQAKWDFIF